MADKELQDVSEVKEISGLWQTQEVNAYLKLGWKLLMTYKVDRGELGQPSQEPRYVLGWIPQKRQPGMYYEPGYGEPIHPDAKANRSEAWS